MLPEVFLTVGMLMAGTGSDHYKTREACSKTLAQLNNRYDLRLYIAPYTHNSDMEVARHARALMAEYNNPFGTYSAVPRLDSVNLEKEEHWYFLYQQCYSVVYSYTSKDNKTWVYKWFRLSHADDNYLKGYTVEYMNSLQRKGVPRPAIVGLLKYMREQEKKKRFAVPLLPPWARTE